jgi:hypothetical protein
MLLRNVDQLGGWKGSDPSAVLVPEWMERFMPLDKA